MDGPTSELHASASAGANHPALDFRSLSKDAPAEIRQQGLRVLDDALRTHGFVYLSHHGIAGSLVNATFDWMKHFFAFPPAIKSSIRRSTNPLEPRGYTTIGDAVLDQDGQPQNLEELAGARSQAPVEQRETLELGSPYSQSQQRNRLLPEDVFPGFADWLDNWWDACMSLQLSLMEYFDEILTAESATPGLLVQQQDTDESHSNMSLIHYHRVDNVGGLEVCDGRSPSGQTRFVPVPPKPGTIIVQVGDMLEKQSNGRWRSALHRVTAPPLPGGGGGGGDKSSSANAADAVDVLQDRYSAAFFVYPQFHTKIEPLPGCTGVGPWNSMDWGGVQTAGEWWQKRIQLEFGSYQSKLAKV